MVVTHQEAELFVTGDGKLIGATYRDVEVSTHPGEVMVAIGMRATEIGDEFRPDGMHGIVFAIVNVIECAGGGVVVKGLHLSPGSEAIGCRRVFGDTYTVAVSILLIEDGFGIAIVAGVPSAGQMFWQASA